MELVHERHNRAATEIVNRIIKDFPQTDRFVVVESIIAGVIGSLNFKQPAEAGVDWALNALSKGAKERIMKFRASREHKES